MESIFGVPARTIALLLGVVWALAALVLLRLGLRSRVLVWIGLRHLPRRRAQTILITLGLMLSSTIVTTALGTGDTMSRAIRTVVTASLGRADEVIVPGGRSGWRERVDAVEGLARGDAAVAASRGWFPYSEYERIAGLSRDVPSVAALSPAAAQLRTAVNRGSRLTAPDIKLLAVPTRYDPTFGPIMGPSGPVDLSQLGPNEVYLNKEAAAALGAKSGDQIEMTGGEYWETEAWRLSVREVVSAQGLAGLQPTALLSLERFWARDTRWNPEPDINLILVANQGDEATSVERSREATRALRAAIADKAVAAELYGIMSEAGFREQLQRYAEEHDRELDEEERLVLASLGRELGRGEPTAEFVSLMGDPEMIHQLGHMATESLDASTVYRAQGLLTSLHPLAVHEIKRLGTEQADLAGSLLTSTFIVLGLFSIVVGVMLIFLIFVMLAAERRSEMGTMRAVGVKRRHLVQVYLFEGAAYSLIASAAGVLAGLLVGRLAVALMGRILSEFGVRITPYFAPRSLLIAFCLGGLLTFSAVVLSAWRVSRLNIVAAMRDLPEDARARGHSAGWLAGVMTGPVRAGLLLLLGLSLLRLAKRLEQVGVWGLGVSLLLIGVALLLRWVLARLGLRWGDRAVFTLAGLGLIGYWSRPPEKLARAGEFPLDLHVEVFVLGGVMMVLGAIWVIIYNLDVLLRLLEVVLGRLPRMAVVLRTALAYPRHARFRTGTVLAMFALVIFTMVIGSVLTRAMGSAYTDTDAMTGGFELAATAGDEITDIESALATASAIRPDEFAAVGSLSQLGVESLRLDVPVARWHDAWLTVVDDGWLRGAEFGLIARAPGYGSDAEVWRALREQPGLAVAVPGSDTEGMGFTVSESVEETDVWLRDARGGRAQSLRVIGVLDPRADLSEGLVTHGDNVASAFPAFGWESYAFKLAPGVDARRAALGLELSFEEQRMSVDLSGEQALQRQAIRILLNYLLTGFMGLGLVVGIAALGVIATRAVVERRRHLAMMRAIGYGSGSVQAGLVLEASIVAALGIGMGVLLGLVVARNIVRFFAADYPEILWVVPWQQIAFLSVAAWAAVLLTTIAPAWQAGRVSPAEGLRTE